MSDSMAVLSFRDVPQRRSPALIDHLQRMESIANRVWIPHMRPDAGSHAGWSHLKNVERNAGKIVPDAEKQRLSDGEIFLLLAAVLLHEVGRVAALDEERPCPLENAEQCYVYQNSHKLHPCWSYKLIKDYWYRFGLPDDHIAGYCALLALWHGMDQPPGEPSDCKPRAKLSATFSVGSLDPYGILRLPLLAAILRVADETENNWTRAIDPIWLRIQDAHPEHLHKAFRRGIEDIEFCIPGRAIIYYVPELDIVSRGQHGEHASPGLLSDTNKVLDAWGHLLADIGVEYGRAIISSRGRFYAARKQAGVEEIALTDAFPHANVRDVWKRLKELYSPCVCVLKAPAPPSLTPCTALLGPLRRRFARRLNDARAPGR